MLLQHGVWHPSRVAVYANNGNATACSSAHLAVFLNHGLPYRRCAGNHGLVWWYSRLNPFNWRWPLPHGINGYVDITTVRPHRLFIVSNVCRYGSVMHGMLRKCQRCMHMNPCNHRCGMTMPCNDSHRVRAADMSALRPFDTIVENASVLDQSLSTGTIAILDLCRRIGHGVTIEAIGFDRGLQLQRSEGSHDYAAERRLLASKMDACVVRFL